MRAVSFLFGFAFFVALAPAHTVAQEKKSKADPTAKWESFTSAAGKFKTKFPPGKIEEKTMDVPVGTEKIKLYLFGFESEKTAFLASYCDYPNDTIAGADTEDMLDNVVKGMLKGMNAKEKATDKIKMEGLSAREVSFELPDLKASGKARALIVKNRLYQVIAFDVDEKRADEIDAFVKAFKLNQDK